MENFPVPTRDQVSAGNQASFDNLHKALGMVPNLYATIAHSENGLERYLAFQGAKTSLSNKEKEAVNLVVSEVNGCTYCPGLTHQNQTSAFAASEATSQSVVAVKFSNLI